MSGEIDIPHIFNVCGENRNCQDVLDAVQKGLVDADTTYQDFSLLHIVAANGRTSIAKLLLDKKCDINRKEPVSNLKINEITK